MKTLKRILLVLLALVAILLLIALFVKKDYAVEREITINKPVNEVFDYIKPLKNQDNYSVWNRKDPAMKREYIGTDGTVGFVTSWDSEISDVGKGAQEIKKITEKERIDMELRFEKPFKATDYAYFVTEPKDSTHTNVKWGFYGKMNYPMNLILLCFSMDEMLGKDLNHGLTDLKSILEK